MKHWVEARWKELSYEKFVDEVGVLNSSRAASRLSLSHFLEDEYQNSHKASLHLRGRKPSNEKDT
jgi:hypothetical protein